LAFKRDSSRTDGRSTGRSIRQALYRESPGRNLPAPTSDPGDHSPTFAECDGVSARGRAADMGILERWFGLSEAGTDVRTEIEAGVTTFLTMAYILVVNPQILGDAGVPVEGALFATAASAAIGSILMGFLANYPFALAPGMGLNAYFTYTVV